MFRRLATAAFLSIAFAAGAFAADTKPHRVAIQVNQIPLPVGVSVQPTFQLGPVAGAQPATSALSSVVTNG